jgi:hypothetical protein
MASVSGTEGYAEAAENLVRQYESISFADGDQILEMMMRCQERFSLPHHRPQIEVKRKFLVEPPHRRTSRSAINRSGRTSAGEEMNTHNVLRSACDTASFPSRRRTEYNS